MTETEYDRARAARRAQFIRKQRMADESAARVAKSVKPRRAKRQRNRDYDRGDYGTVIYG